MHAPTARRPRAPTSYDRHARADPPIVAARTFRRQGHGGRPRVRRSQPIERKCARHDVALHGWTRGHGEPHDANPSALRHATETRQAGSGGMPSLEGLSRSALSDRCAKQRRTGSAAGRGVPCCDRSQPRNIVLGWFVRGHHEKDTNFLPMAGGWGRFSLPLPGHLKARRKHTRIERPGKATRPLAQHLSEARAGVGSAPSKRYGCRTTA